MCLLGISASINPIIEINPTSIIALAMSDRTHHCSLLQFYSLYVYIVQCRCGQIQIVYSANRINFITFTCHLLSSLESTFPYWLPLDDSGKKTNSGVIASFKVQTIVFPH
ncbi:unnamed protein product [Chrysodeixis includens]|uniref:Uncharacterized protein n=1 Tax=Chrysodeixis includens TaxID=689277 RepID=A0A9P0FZ81_CHRIL|nr:unnamed protein product [Chrysodeixis includens]